MTMPISEAQLSTWSNQGSKVQSAATYAAIKNVLEDPHAPYANRLFEVFLQGSYGNDTNIYADSDVDIVICLTEAYNGDTDELTEAEKAAYNTATTTASYGFKDFRADVLKWLVVNFGASVEDGNKAILVAGNSSRRDADVLPCMEHQRFTSFRSTFDNRHHTGIVFWTKSWNRIINFPKQHTNNCIAKNSSTMGRFKPNVRVFKNARNAMIEDGILREGVAPSYFLEGLLYNVPDRIFQGGFQQIFENALSWIEQCDSSQLVCANELYYLVRERSTVCWSSENYRDFVSAARRFWQKGGR